MNPYGDLVIANSTPSAYFVVNDHKIRYNTDTGVTAAGLSTQAAFHVKVRPDVTALSVLDLAEQVLISLGGGLVIKHGDLDSRYRAEAGRGRGVAAEVSVGGDGGGDDEDRDWDRGRGRDAQQPQTAAPPTAPSSSSSADCYMEITSRGRDGGDHSSSTSAAGRSLWSSVRVYLGVNEDLQRVLSVLVTAPQPFKYRPEEAAGRGEAGEVAGSGGAAIMAAASAAGQFVAQSAASSAAVAATSLRNTITTTFLAPAAQEAWSDRGGGGADWSSGGGDGGSDGVVDEAAAAKIIQQRRQQQQLQQQATVPAPADAPSVESLLLLLSQQSRFLGAFSVLSRLFALSLFEEYLTAAFLGLYMDSSRNSAWLQQYISSVRAGGATPPAPGNVGSAPGSGGARIPLLPLEGGESSSSSSVSVSDQSAMQALEVASAPTGPTMGRISAATGAPVPGGGANAPSTIGRAQSVYTPYDEDVRNDRDEGDQRAQLLPAPGAAVGAMRNSASTGSLPVTDITAGALASAGGGGGGGTGSGSASALVSEYFSTGAVNSYHHCSLVPPEVLKSLLDLDFALDLQRAFAHDLRETLAAAAEQLDQRVEAQERSTSRLMTTLKGIYKRSGLPLPAAPRSRPLSDFPLHLPKALVVPSSSSSGSGGSSAGKNSSGASIVDASLDTAAVLVYKARKYQRLTMQKFQHILHASHAVNESTCLHLQYADAQGEARELLYLTTHIQEVLHSVYMQLQGIIKDEAVARITRKIAAVSLRVHDLERYKLALLTTLHWRTSSALGVHMTSREDKAALAAFRKLFRVIKEDEEPVLYEGSCTVSVQEARADAATAPRSGTVHVTAGHLCYHSNYALLLESLQLVIPWTIVHSVQFGDRTVLQAPTAGSEEEDKEAGAICGVAKAAAAAPTNVIVVTDVSGKRTLLNVGSSGIPEQASRVFDLLVLLLRARAQGALRIISSDCFDDGLASVGADASGGSGRAEAKADAAAELAETRAAMWELAVGALASKILGGGTGAGASRNKQLIAHGIIAHYERYGAADAADASDGGAGGGGGGDSARKDSDDARPSSSTAGAIAIGASCTPTPKTRGSVASNGGTPVGGGMSFSHSSNHSTASGGAAPAGAGRLAASLLEWEGEEEGESLRESVAISALPATPLMSPAVKGAAAVMAPPAPAPAAAEVEDPFSHLSFSGDSANARGAASDVVAAAAAGTPSVVVPASEAVAAPAASAKPNKLQSNIQVSGLQHVP